MKKTNHIRAHQRNKDRVPDAASLIDNISDALISTDMEFNVLGWNAAAEQMYGWTAAEAIGQSVPDIFRTEYPGTTQDKVIEVLLQGGVWKGEVIHSRKDGARFPVMASVSLLRQPTGEPVGFVTINRDITDRKQVEERLLQSEERFSKSFDSAPTGLVLSRLSNSKFEYVNESFLKLVDYQREEVIGKNWVELNLFPDLAQIARVRELLIETKQVRNMETRIRSSKGEIKHVLFSVDIILIDQQPYSLTTIMDITDRIRAEKQVLQMKRLYATLSQVNQTIVRVKSHQELYQSICDVALKFGELTLTWIGLLDEATGDIRPVAASGLGVDTADWPLPIVNVHTKPALNEVIVEAVHTSNTVTSDDVQTDERTTAFRDVIQKFGFHSLAAVPFRLRGKTIGVLVMISTESGIFKAEEELKLFDEMGLDISFALDTMEVEKERRQAEEKVERQNRRLQILHEIDVAILAADSLENIIGAALDHIRELIECRRVSMVLIDWGTNEVVVFGVRAVSETTVQKGTRVPLALFQNMLQTLSTNQPLLINDLNALADPPPQIQSLLREGWRSLCLLPLFSQGSLLGSISLSSEMPGFFDEEKISLGWEVANQVAIAITHKRLLDELLEGEEKYRTFFQNSMDAILLTSPDGSIHAANPAACRMFGRSEAEIGALSRDSLVDPGDPRLKALLEERQRTGRTFGELTMLRQDGSPFPVEMSSALFQDGQGNTRTSTIIRDITERKQAEEKLLRSEKKFSDAFHQSPAAMTITRIADGTFVDANEAFLHTFGFTREEVIGHRSTELNILDVEARRTLIERQLASGGLRNAELAARSKSGKTINLLFSSSPLDIDNEAHHITTMIDITERKQAEQRLRESEQKYSVLFDKSTVPAALLRLPEVVIVDVNEALEKLTGYTKQEFMGRTGAEMGLEKREVRERMIAEFEEQGSLFDNEVRIITKSGEERIIVANTNPVELNGRPYALTTAHDITDRRRAEEALRSSQAQLSGIFESAMDAIISVDTNQRIMLANAAAEQMFGYRAAEMIGKSLHELLPNRFHEQHQQQVNESVSTGVITRALNAIGITYGLRANGEEFPVEASISQISVDAEKMYTVILRDITERKQYEEQLHALNAELENRVAERTLELNRTNIELEHANKAKDEFLATMSHELRTPLNSILGLSESLLEEKRGPLNAYQQHALGIIGSSGQHLLELINDILDLSKIDAGKFDYYPQEVSVDEVCRTSMAFIKEQAVRKSITILYNNEAAISRISADPRRLKQILVNLLSNAVKFTPEKGTVTLEVTGNVLAEVIHFSVIDTGIGIAPDDLQKLFQPFVQVDSQLNRQYAGTGLGLALVQKLTDLQGGSVEVESELGRGSRFTINLPCRQDKIEKPEAAGPQVPQPVQPSAGNDAGSQKMAEENIVILLAEDNPTNILTLNDYLGSYGYKILIAHDGAEAIEIAAASHPDLILMDIQMPVMDGLEAIRRLRAAQYSASVPIIALTALAMPGDRERCLEAGASEYISKPVSLKILRQKIMSLLKNKV